MKTSPLNSLQVIIFALLSCLFHVHSFTHATKIQRRTIADCNQPDYDTTATKIQRRTIAEDYDTTPCPSLLSDDCKSDQWHDFCEDVDEIMACLVSPAPESFCVLHSTISRINGEREGFSGNIGGNALNDLRALSFLIKPEFAIDLYEDADILKWRLIPRAGLVIHCIQRGKPELYHEHNPLQLSRLAVDLATKTPNDPMNLPKVHYFARQAEVSNIQWVNIHMHAYW